MTPTIKSKGKTSEIGAPAQFKQATRKGKKAWRKNIDIQPEETAMDEARAEERVTGGKAGGSYIDQMFTIDTTGDEMVAKRIKKPRTLRSLEILQKRSAVPALTSKPVHAASKPYKPKVTTADKERLLRIARKGQVGADGSGMGSAIVAKQNQEDLRDVWTERELEAERLAALKGKWEENLKEMPLPNVPTTLQQQRQVQSATAQTKSVPIPNAGTSYNPRLEAHQALIDEAVRQEVETLRKEQEAQDKVERYKKVLENRREMAKINGTELSGGMLVASGDPEVMAESAGLEIEDVEFEVSQASKMTKRKTQADRNKAKRRIEERRIAKQAATVQAQKKAMQTLANLQKKVENTLTSRKEVLAARRAALEAKQLVGYQGGEKIGKHKVLSGNVDVQLGEDLSENMREVKPEGNLFRDRFRALQSRTLLEPRVRQLPKRHTGRTKEYEKHAWKRFE